MFLKRRSCVSVVGEEELKEKEEELLEESKEEEKEEAENDRINWVAHGAASQLIRLLSCTSAPASCYMMRVTSWRAQKWQRKASTSERTENRRGAKNIVNPLIIDGLRDLTGIPEDANDEEAEGEEDDEEDVDEEDEGESEKKRNSQKEKEEARQHIKIIKPQRW